MYDIEKILSELESLPKWDDQICLQAADLHGDDVIHDSPAWELGCGRIKELGYDENEFTIPIFDMDYTYEILKKLGMYRTRVLRLKPGRCYSYHYDPTKRIHIPLITNKKCFMIIGKEVIHLPADGNHYLVDTTQDHTALNAHRKKDRIHIVGCYGSTSLWPRGRS